MTTRDEIMAMDEDALRIAVAMALGYDRRDITPDWPYDIRATFELEAQIPEGVSRSAYANILFDIVDARGSGIIWKLIHASPADRCRAWLMATV